MGYNIHKVLGLLALIFLISCGSDRAIEHGVAKAANGEKIKTCFDKEMMSDLPGHLNIAALPSLTRAGFASLAQTQEEARKTPGPWVIFRDNHNGNPVGHHPSPVRKCWKNGDPRKNGLYRYKFGSTSYPEAPRTALYSVYFDGDKAVYVEGWVHKQTNYKAVDMRPWDGGRPPKEE